MEGPLQHSAKIRFSDMRSSLSGIDYNYVLQRENIDRTSESARPRFPTFTITSRYEMIQGGMNQDSLKELRLCDLRGIK